VTKKIAVLGNVCIDEIHTHDGEVIEGLGGSIHNQLMLSLLFANKGVICPVCKIGYDLYDDLLRKYKSWQNIDPGSVIKVNGKNNRVKLKYFSENARKEYSVFNPPEIKFQELKGITDCDLFLVNFVSGIEISRKTFEEMTNRIDVPFFVDLHSLFLGFKDDGFRYYREDEDWSLWYHTGDIMQMNEREAEILSGRKLPDENALIDFGKYLLNFGTKIVLITNGKNGSVLCYRENGVIKWEKIEAYNYFNFSYPTGCGDVFSSGFVYKYLASGDPVAAAHFASQIAGLKAGLKKPEDMLNNFHDYLYKFNIEL